MHVAIPLYPGFTALDAVGPYTVLAFAPGWTVTFVSTTPGLVADDRSSLFLRAPHSYAELARPDVVLVPGGPGTAAAMQDAELIAWLRAVHSHARWTASVCSGSFLLGAAGILRGRRATTHWGWLDRLAVFGAEPVADRVVFDGDVVTAAGVSAGIDMALQLLAREGGERLAQTVQLAIEYDPRPPFNCGTPATAPPGLAEEALQVIG